MDRVGAERVRGSDDRGPVEIGFRGGSGADPDRRIERVAEECPGIGIGVHPDRRDAQLARAASDPNRDFAAVGDEQAPDHRSCQLAARCSKNARKPS